ncbi:MAG TPA: HRDC domain-containing protein [bacterium]|nr:HRDC domain-containing protein [bacterium]
MQYKIFTIPIINSVEFEEELNAFLKSKKIISVKKELIKTNKAGYWTFLVEYIETTTNGSFSKNKKNIVDYKEILTSEEFIIFSKLRDIRKEIAEKEKLQPFLIFTNEQLSEMIKNKVKTTKEVGAIYGIGANKAEKYGANFIKAVNEFYETRK